MHVYMFAQMQHDDLIKTTLNILVDICKVFVNCDPKG